jgi:hypothetical protein
MARTAQVRTTAATEALTDWKQLHTSQANMPTQPATLQTLSIFVGVGGG